MLTCIPRPRTPELNPPRGAVYPISNHYEDYNGRTTLSIWYDFGRPSLPPLYSFQVYVTFDAAPAEASDREGLAIKIRRHILGVTPYEQRLDVRFLRPGEGITDIMDSHRALVHAEHADPSKMVMPSYTNHEFNHYNSFIFIISDLDWEQEGLKGLYFDPITPDPITFSASVEPYYELDLVDDDAEDCARDIFTSWELNEDYAELFADARNLRMTEWQEVFDAAKRMNMLQV